MKLCGIDDVEQIPVDFPSAGPSKQRDAYALSLAQKVVDFIFPNTECVQSILSDDSDTPTVVDDICLCRGGILKIMLSTYMVQNNDIV